MLTMMMCGGNNQPSAASPFATFNQHNSLFSSPSNTIGSGLYLETRFIVAGGRDENRNNNQLAQYVGLSLIGNNCSIALLARTSGVLLFVGVGTYIAYRVCVRYFGRNFICALIEQIGENTAKVFTNDIVSNRQTSYEQKEDVGYECRRSIALITTDDECSEDDDDAISVDSGETHETLLTPEGTPRRKKFSRTAIRHRHNSQLSTESSRVSCSQQQQQTRSHDSNDGSAMHGSRPTSTPHKKIRRCHHAPPPPATTHSDDQDAVVNSEELSGSECDASLRLVWDGDAMWDNDGMFASAADRCCCHSPIPSEMSDISTGAIRFPTFDMNGRLSSANNFDKIANDLTDIRDEFSAIDNDISSLLQRSHCMQDSKHLYRSVVLANSDIASSDIMSVCSGGGAYSDGGSSFGAFRRHTQDMQHNAKGLLDMPTVDKCDSLLDSTMKTSSTDYTSPMTDSSATGKSFSSSSAAQHPSSLHRSMMDSAIGTDMISSEDECSPFSRSINSTTAIIDSNKNLSSSYNRPLPIWYENECQSTEPPTSSSDRISIITSEHSMEWCDDDVGGLTRDDDGIAVGGNDEVIDLDLGTLMLAACERQPSTSAASIVSSLSDIHGRFSDANEHHMRIRSNINQAPKHSRDLMVYARERFADDLSLINILHQLYNKRRLRRIASIQTDHISSNKLENYMNAVLQSIIYHRYPIFQCKTFVTVQETIDAAFKRCDFLRHWCFPDSIANRFLTSRSPDAIRIAMISCLRVLWKMTTSDTDNQQIDSAGIEALRILMVLRAIDALDATVLNRHPVRPFYADLFSEHNPKEVMQRLDNGLFNDLELALLADTVHVRIEVIDCTENRYKTSSRVHHRRHTIAVYPDKSCRWSAIVMLKCSTIDLLPLYYLAE